MSPRTHAHRSGPVRSDVATRAIAQATFAELADRGLQELSIDGVARRAGVGKAAIYRRWPSKREMVLALLAEVGADRDLLPDTGGLESDLREWFAIAEAHLRHPQVARIVPDLLAQIARDADFAEAVFARIGAVRREHAFALVRRAIARGELPPHVDLELAADLIAAPLYWRLAVTRQALTADGRERLVRVTLAALRAA